MNTYDKLKFHLERHMYKRGTYKGDAPADKSRRGRSHHRVVERTQFIAIRFHNTDIVRAYPDGRVMIDCNGWASSITTMTAVRDANKFLTFELVVGSRSVMGLNQVVVRTKDGPMVRYYDGITFDGEGNIITPLRTFRARRIDKAESKEFMDGLQASGFKNMYKLLYNTVQPPEGTAYVQPRRLNDVLTNPEHAADWPHLIAKYKYAHKWVGFSGIRDWVEVDNAKTCWSRIMAVCKRSMYNDIDTEVVSIK
jgi:hypothetical protein